MELVGLQVLIHKLHHRRLQIGSARFVARSTPVNPAPENAQRAQFKQRVLANNSRAAQRDCAPRHCSGSTSDHDNDGTPSLRLRSQATFRTCRICASTSLPTQATSAGSAAGLATVSINADVSPKSLMY